MSRYLIAGMSHVESLRRGWLSLEDTYSCSFDILNLRCYRRPLSSDNPDAPRESRRGRNLYIDPAEIASDFARYAKDKDAVVLCINGNEHNIIGLTEIDRLEDALRIVGNGVRKALDHWVGLLHPHISAPVLLLVPPPPIESEEHIRTSPGEFREKFELHPLRASGDRLQLWQRQREVTEQYGKQHGVVVLQPPDSVFSASGFLATDCCGADPTHGNANYGRRAIAQVVSALESATAPSRPTVVGHPYTGLPEYAYWKQSISEVEGSTVDPVVKPRFLIHDRDQVATAGSCFAQHISKRLRSGGFRFLVAEQPVGDQQSAEQRGFYDFSARYGNIYTARQLRQLFDRAFGYFRPLECVWPHPQGGFCDPFRPRIEPDGFASEEAVINDMRLHLDAVRAMFQQLDVFVFTLGLTECWVSRLDGAAYPIAPGVAGGQYDPSRHAFVNFGVAEVKADMDAFLTKLKLVNPEARVLLTVSPVPLVATREDRHVLVSTVHSKSVLRVVAGDLAASHPQVEYFPSYEIITGPQASGAYFAADRRSVTQAGVDHVMRVFMARMTAGTASVPANDGQDDTKTKAYAEMEAAAEAACDEELYARDPHHEKQDVSESHL